MALFPPEPNMNELLGFDENDLFQHKNFAENITQLLNQNDEHIVALLDSPWGSGKSTFIHMWAGYLRQQGFPVIVFDAFKNDYQDDPFTALIGEIYNLQKDLTEHSTSDLLLQKSVALGKFILKSGATAIGGKVLAQVAEDVGGLSSEQLLQLIEGVSSEAIKSSITHYSKSKQVFDEFRKALSEFTTEISQDEKPLIFIIDELDRCRPDFALNLLEKIKHFFDVANVHFVISTHLEVLQSIVSNKYGTGINTETYLQKFYNIHLTLPNFVTTHNKLPSNDVSINDVYSEYLSKHLEHLKDKEIISTIKGYANAHKLSLRELNKFSTYCNIASKIKQKDGTYFDATLVTGLALIKTLQPNLLEKLRNKDSTFEEINAFLKLDKIGNTIHSLRQRTYYQDDWEKYLLTENEWLLEKNSRLRERHRHASSHLESYRGERTSFIPLLIRVYFDNISLY